VETSTILPFKNGLLIYMPLLKMPKLLKEFKKTGRFYLKHITLIVNIARINKNKDISDTIGSANLSDFFSAPYRTVPYRTVPYRTVPQQTTYRSEK
jgi:hypothetical protein